MHTVTKPGAAHGAAVGGRGRARRRRWRHRLHRTGAAAAAGPPSGRAAHPGDLVGRRLGGPAASGARAAVGRRDHAARTGRAEAGGRPGVSGAARCGGRRARADAGRRGRSRHRPVGRVPAARPDGPRALVSGEHAGCRRTWRMDSPSTSATAYGARGWWPIRAAIRPRRFWRWRRWPPPACWCRART